jgi:hypothetical protein
MEYFRMLEKTLIANVEGDQSNQLVLTELSRFQNEDGGFGHGLEPDFFLPDSSAMATSIGLRILHELETSETKNLMIEKAIGYLWNTYDEERPGWWAVPKRVNEYPHAPWWQWNLEENMTVIDHHWGNPNAELIGYLCVYSDDPRVMKLVDIAIDHLLRLVEYDSEHEVFCYLRFCELVRDDRIDQLRRVLKKAVSERIVYDESQWNEYVPKPLDYLRYTTSNWLEIDDTGIRKNLDMLEKQIDENGFVDVNWSWGYDEVNWEIAKKHWRGVLTLAAIRLKERYGDSD